MNIIQTEKPYIYEIRKSVYDDIAHLDWKSIECKDYLIVNTAVFDKERSIITDSLDCELLSVIKNNKEVLLSQKKYISDSLSLQLVSHTDLRKNGGISVGNNPGFYIVYGIKFIGIDDFDIYVYPNSYEESSINLSVDLTIAVSPYYVDKKGLFSFGSKKIYSGYKKVVLDKKISSLKCGDVFYIICNNVFPIPTEVLNNTRVFYVKANENDTIEFNTKIKEIIIKES